MLEDDVDLFMAIARALDAEPADREVAELDTRSTGRNAGIGMVRAPKVGKRFDNISVANNTVANKAVGACR